MPAGLPVAAGAAHFFANLGRFSEKGEALRGAAFFRGKPSDPPSTTPAPLGPRADAGLRGAPSLRSSRLARRRAVPTAARST